MTSREYLISVLYHLNDCDNNYIPLYLKQKVENINFVYFTKVVKNSLLSLVGIRKDDKNIFCLITITNNIQNCYASENLELLLKNLTKVERKNILGIPKKLVPPREIADFYQFDYLSYTSEELVCILNSKKDSFNISGLVAINDDFISKLAVNPDITNITLNNNYYIRNLAALFALFPNCSEVIISNMKHINDANFQFRHNWSKVIIANCSVTMRVLLNLTKVEIIRIYNINLECQLNMYSTVIEEWPTFSCKELLINSNNLTMDSIKAITMNMPELLNFYILDTIINKMRSGAVKSGYEKEVITFISTHNEDNRISYARDLKWKSLLIDNCPKNNLNTLI